MKSQTTERMRVSANDAMDVHGGKGVQDGPLNYLGGMYRSVPIGITVEGANIVTRALIQFGQGAIRCHPYLLKEMAALAGQGSRARARRSSTRCSGRMSATALPMRSAPWGRAWTGGIFAPAPDAGGASRFYKPLGRYTSAFALAVDFALLTMGGGLKRREMISARFGDILSELFLLSAVLKRWEDEGRQAADLPLVRLVHGGGLRDHRDALRRNLRQLSEPAGGVAAALHGAAVRPHRRGPSDRLTEACASILLEPSATRDRLTVDIFHADGEHDGVARLERAFRLKVASHDVRERMRKARVRDIGKARAQGLINDAEAANSKNSPKPSPPRSRSTISRPKNWRPNRRARETSHR